MNQGEQFFAQICTILPLFHQVMAINSFRELTFRVVENIFPAHDATLRKKLS